MKNLMLTFAALLIICSATFAQTKANKSSENEKLKKGKEVLVVDQNVKKKEVDLNDLPAPILKKLKSKDMTPWKPTKAYLTKEGVYIVEMMNGKNQNETKEMKFEKDGTIIDK